MGRKRKEDVTIDDLIIRIENEIKQLNEQIKQKRNRIKELKEEKSNKEKNDLINAINESGKTIEEVMQLLKNKLIL